MMKELTAEEKRWLKAVGQRVRELRIQKGYGSFEFFAWEHKISSATIKNMEHGKNATLVSLKRVLKALDVSPEEFFRGI